MLHVARLIAIKTASYPAISNASEREACKRIEQSKGKAGEKTQSGVGNLEIFFDRLQEDRQNLPVDEVKNINDEQYTQDVIRVRSADLGWWLTTGNSIFLRIIDTCRLRHAPSFSHSKRSLVAPGGEGVKEKVISG